MSNTFVVLPLEAYRGQRNSTNLETYNVSEALAQRD